MKIQVERKKNPDQVLVQNIFNITHKANNTHSKVLKKGTYLPRLSFKQNVKKMVEN